MADPSSWTLPNGERVDITPVAGGFTAQLYDGQGIAEGGAFSATQSFLGLYTFESLTALAGGGYALDYTYAGALLPGFFIENATFSASGQLLGQSQVSAPSTENGGFPQSAGQVYALPDGGFVEAWTDRAPYATSGPSEVEVREFDAQGQPVGDAAQGVGVLLSGQPSVQVDPDGRYIVSWQSPSGAQQQTFAEQASAPTQSAQTSQTTQTPVADADDSLVANQPVTLTASAGWTGAALLSNGQLTIVSVQGGDYGSHTAASQTYDSMGNETNSAALMGYAGAGQTLTPEIASLGVGQFYEVSYAGSSNYEIYNGADHLVFIHNAYTNPNAQFTGLQNGGYVVTDFTGHDMGLYDSQGNNVGWFGLTGSAPASIVARADGGFDFVYTDHILGYNAQGQQDLSTAFGVATSGFASATAALNGSAVTSVWLSPDDGQNGLATSIRFQWLAPGANENRAVEIAQDLDPWHTTFALEAHADGSEAILWSQGGGVFGAEYNNGEVGSAYAAFAGDLSTTRVIQTAGDKVGMAWVQGGDVWAEVFDPSTGAAVRADLGASDGNLANVHALGTASGAVAVSWHQANGSIVGEVLDAAGVTSAPIALPGDFLGVDAAGYAVTLHDQGGMPVMQTYALSTGLFWHG